MKQRIKITISDQSHLPFVDIFFPFFDSIRVNQDQLDFTVIVKVNDCLNRRYI